LYFCLPIHGGAVTCGLESERAMPILSYRLIAIAVLLFALAALPSKSHTESPTPCVAVFAFEMTDHSLDGEINGVNKEEQARLELLTAQLRQWIDAGSGWKSCDMAPVAAEAEASNLSFCGCVQRLSQAVGGRFAVVASVHKVSNLILNIRVDVFDVSSNRLIIQQNADIRSNTDSSWKRGLDWLIKHRLAGALASLGESP
jgi:hypothetical protein